jgi:hypothetical protein
MKKLSKLTWMACLLLFLSFPVTVSAISVVTPPCAEITCGMLIHWDFDGTTDNSGDFSDPKYNLVLSPKSYVNDLNEVPNKALPYTSTDSSSLSNVMNLLNLLPEADTTVSFYLNMNGIWGHYVLVASETDESLKLFINNFLITNMHTTNPVAFLKSIDFASIASLADSKTTFSGAIDDFRVYNRELSRTNISQLSQPIISKQMGLNASSKISMDDIVKYMKMINTTDREYLQGLLEMISQIS